MSTFTYQGKDFLMNGKPYRVLSGAMHYFRIVPEYWKDRLEKLRACGFNTVETYVPWALHERKEGTFDFSGGLDLVKYVQTAAEARLNVIVRPGPYICAEFEFGGLPSWLLAYPHMKLRCCDSRYLEKMRPYYREVLTRLKPYLCTNGGPVIMLQIENEYGSYGDDKDYLRAVASMYREFGADCLLYTSDGPLTGMLSGGTLPEYPCVANFGSHPEEAFRVLSDFRPNQPSMCGEFWCGWFDHWGEEHHVRSAEETMADVQPMIDSGASFNFYMFHGGTNFGFMNGANCDEAYTPTITSYDYSSPLTENGDMTATYFAVQKALSAITDIPELTVSDLPKKAYGQWKVTGYAPLFDNLSIGRELRSAAPLTMEEAGQDFGYILYSTTVNGPLEERSIVMDDVHDRALVYLNGRFAGIIDRFGRTDDIRIRLGKNESVKLDILVENCGRVNYGRYLFDRKGALEGVRLGNRFHFGWNNTVLTMDDLSPLTFRTEKPAENAPSFIRGTLTVDGTPADTFIRTAGLHKGFITVNGFNIGRYWNDSKPQKTLYIPAPLLHEGDNEVIIFESDDCGRFTVTFEDKPDLG